MNVDFTKSNNDEKLRWSQSVLSELEMWRDRLETEKDLEPKDSPDYSRDKRVEYYNDLIQFMDTQVDYYINKMGVKWEG